MTDADKRAYDTLPPRDARSARIYETVCRAVYAALVEQSSTVPMKRGSAEAKSLARVAANAAVEEDELRAQERLDVIRVNEAGR
jgi:hypothetical protein